MRLDLPASLAGLATLGIALGGVTVASGCAPYDASLKVTLEGQAGLGLTAGGGYRLELRGPNGEILEGLDPVFVPFAEGKQTVGAVVRSFEPETSVFAEGENAAPLILRVEARLQPEGAAVAIGTTRVRVRRHRPIEATVNLRPDPRPLGSGFELRYATDWAGVASGDVGAPDSSLAIERSPALPEGGAFHAWVCEPTCAEAPPRWLGEVAASLDGTFASLLFVDDNAPLIERILEFQITAENADLGEGSLVLPLGFVVASGQLEVPRQEALAALLGTREENVGGQLQTIPADTARIQESLVIAATHAAFAAATGRDDAYIQLHTGHTFWTLASGSPGDPNLPTASPLPTDLQTRGLLGDGNVEGLLPRLDREATAAAEMTASPEVAAAALQLAGTMTMLRAATCEAWAWALWISMGACTVAEPPECTALDCATLTAATVDLPQAAQAQLQATQDAATLLRALPGGEVGDPLIDAIERMSRFTATAADAGP